MKVPDLMKISILVSTYGDSLWSDLAHTRALPSADGQGAYEILFLHDSDGSIASVRNRNAERASGDLLVHLDADDELAPGYLDAMRRALEQERGDLPPQPFLLTPAVSYVHDGRAEPPLFRDRGIPLSEDNWLVVGTLVERELFHAVGGFSDYPHGFEDWSLWAKCWKAGARIVKVPDAVYVAHVNPNSQHRQRWRDHEWQVATHNRVRAELFG